MSLSDNLVEIHYLKNDSEAGYILASKEVIRYKFNNDYVLYLTYCFHSEIEPVNTIEVIGIRDYFKYKPETKTFSDGSILVASFTKKETEMISLEQRACNKKNLDNIKKMLKNLENR